MKHIKLALLGAMLPATAMAWPNSDTFDQSSQNESDQQQSDQTAQNETYTPSDQIAQNETPTPSDQSGQYQAPGQEPSQGQGQLGQGQFSRGPRMKLGLMVTAMTPELREHFGAPQDSGLLVTKVAPNGPGARAGIQVGDVITKIDDNPVKNATDISGALATAKDKSNVAIEVVRDHQTQDLQASLGFRRSGEPTSTDQPI